MARRKKPDFNIYNVITDIVHNLFKGGYDPSPLELDCLALTITHLLNRYGDATFEARDVIEGFALNKKPKRMSYTARWDQTHALVISKSSHK